MLANREPILCRALKAVENPYLIVPTSFSRPQFQPLQGHYTPFFAEQIRKMVRLKNRYLLIDILYPDPATWPSTTPKSTSISTSAQLAIHSPTSDALTPGLLAKMIREEVSELYGDCGVGKLGGATAGGLNGRLNTAQSAFAS